MTKFEFQTKWIDFPDEVELPSQVTWAELLIHGDDHCLTRNQARNDKSEIRDFVVGELDGIADWFIENWACLLWEIQTPFPKSPSEESSARWFPSLRDAVSGWQGLGGDAAQLAEWQSRHTLGHLNSDLALPSIVIVPEMRHIVIEVDDLPRKWDSDVRFVDEEGERRNSLRLVLRKDVFRRSVMEFVDSIVKRTQASGQFKQWSQWLSREWQEAQKREADPGTRLRAMLGEVTAERVEKWKAQNRPDIAIALEELLVDCRRIFDEDEAAAIETIVQERCRTAGKSAPKWKQLRKRPQSTIPAHQQGYELAAIVRDELGLGKQPILEMSSLLNRLDVRLDDPVPTNLFRTAILGPQMGEAHLLRSSQNPRMNKLPSARFAVFAALGRLLWSQGAGAGTMVSGAHGDYSRLLQTQRANAFAAEFLLPEAALAARSKRQLSEAEILDLAEEYTVSRSAARWHAYNRGYFESTRVSSQHP